MIKSTTKVKHGNAMIGLQEHHIRLEMHKCGTDEVNFNGTIEHFAIIDDETGAKVGVATQSSYGDNKSEIVMPLADYYTYTEDLVGIGETPQERLYSKKQQLLMKWLGDNPMYGVEVWELSID